MLQSAKPSSTMSLLRLLDEQTCFTSESGSSNGNSTLPYLHLRRQLEAAVYGCQSALTLSRSSQTPQ